MFDTAADLVPHVGEEIGVSDWITVGQDKIDAFAELTGDKQWIHVDVERAKEKMPGGKTIAHGYLVMSLVPLMLIYRVTNFSRALNYGFDRLRFTGPTPSGARIRQRQTLKSCERVEGAYRVTNTCTIEVEGQERPAIVADQVIQYFD
ncbi:MaoC family dehydratase [Sphingosinicella sp. LHD-64]|uniref:MaoC family dehydratase n=1 Tax=Sphingosinicella sp. LHD-64 TaxID=3072139 RepID=UPI00280F947E|nr:MaoC family dehydratase [Sphingosinicella sp. LHD-64]MDQ8757581.1 MaoC family dehydratase [Sphingosinicella sp. LHD-64]